MKRVRILQRMARLVNFILDSTEILMKMGFSLKGEGSSEPGGGGVGVVGSP